MQDRTNQPQYVTFAAQEQLTHELLSFQVTRRQLFAARIRSLDPVTAWRIEQLSYTFNLLTHAINCF